MAKIKLIIITTSITAYHRETALQGG